LKLESSRGSENDITHGFFLRPLKIDEDIEPGKPPKSLRHLPPRRNLGEAAVYGGEAK